MFSDFNDPKGELYKGSKETLEERGYEVQVLNLETPDQSMSYNPLQLIIDAYVRGILLLRRCWWINSRMHCSTIQTPVRTMGL